MSVAATFPGAPREPDDRMPPPRGSARAAKGNDLYHGGNQVSPIGPLLLPNRARDRGEPRPPCRSRRRSPGRRANPTIECRLPGGVPERPKGTTSITGETRFPPLAPFFFLIAHATAVSRARHVGRGDVPRGATRTRR